MYRLPDTLYDQIVADISSQMHMFIRMAAEGNMYYRKTAEQDVPLPDFQYETLIPRDVDLVELGNGRIKVGEARKDGVIDGILYYELRTRSLFYDKSQEVIP